jgi:hypothetical protein
MILRGTNINPSMLQSPLDVAAKKDDTLFIHRSNIQDQYNRYRDYLQTEQGQIVLKLVDPMIARCDRTLSMTSHELGMDPAVAAEYLASVKGEKRVWLQLKCDPDRLKKTLEEYEKMVGPAEQKKGWTEKKKSSEIKVAEGILNPV